MLYVKESNAIRIPFTHVQSACRLAKYNGETRACVVAEEMGKNGYANTLVNVRMQRRYWLNEHL